MSKQTIIMTVDGVDFTAEDVLCSQELTRQYILAISELHLFPVVIESK